MFNRDDQIVQVNFKEDGLFLCLKGLKIKEDVEGIRLDLNFKGKLCFKVIVVSFCIIIIKIFI